MTSPPVWARAGRRSWSGLVRRGVREAHSLCKRFVVFRGDRSAYLRSIGARVGVGCEILTPPGNFGTEPWLIEIGDRVTLSQEVLLVTHDGSSRLFREKYSDSPWGNRFGPIRILDNCFIGARAVLLPGVTVGPDAIIGAGSVVTKPVPAGTVWAGVPARQIGTLAEAEAHYQARMVPIAARTRPELRRELTRFFFDTER